MTDKPCRCIATNHDHEPRACERTASSSWYQEVCGECHDWVHEEEQ